jgi:hypothetical protein
MNQHATSMLSGTRFDAGYFAHETEATLIPLGTAALSSLCVVLMSLVEYPWFAAAGFVVAYGLFWLSLPPEQFPK